MIQFLDDLVFESHELARIQDGRKPGFSSGSILSGFFLYSIVSLAIAGCIVGAAFVIELALAKPQVETHERVFFPWLFCVFALPAYYFWRGGRLASQISMAAHRALPLGKEQGGASDLRQGLRHFA
ncbi:MAG: hypothetical protein AAFQ62_05305 [Pseudomonadota bacterium]